MATDNQVIQYPFSLRWKVTRDEVENFKEFQSETQFAHLSLTSSPSNFKGISYSARLAVAETHADERGKVAVYLFLNPHGISVRAQYSMTLPTIKQTYKVDHIFEKAAHDWGGAVMRSDAFLKPESPAFVNDDFLIEFDGVMTVILPQPKTFILKNELGSILWENANKDFTLVVDDKELHVDRKVLSSCSSVFEGLFHTVKMDSDGNDRLVIDDFSYETVEAAIKFCYQESRHINDSNIADVSKFVDKYDIKGFKDKAEEYMMNTMNNSNVCEYLNASFYLNSRKLELKALKFMRYCIQNGIAIVDKPIVDPNILSKHLKVACCSYLRTEIHD